MTPYRKIKRNYRRQFFSDRRRGFSGISLLLLLLFLACVIGATFAFGYVFRGEVEATVNEFMGTPRPTPTLQANQYAQRGFAHFREGKLDEASSNFELAVTQRPHNVAYLYEYGIILLESGNDQLAAEMGDRAIAAAPADARGYALKARALMWADAASAIPVAVKGLEYGPDFAPQPAILTVRSAAAAGCANAMNEAATARAVRVVASFDVDILKPPVWIFSMAVGGTEMAVVALPLNLSINLM